MGLSRRNRQQRHCTGPQAHLRQAAARVSQHADSGLGPFCRPARRADGQQRSRPPEHRRGAHCADGHHAHRRADRVGAISQRTRRSCRRCSRRARAGGNCICSAWSPTAACTRTRSISTRCCASRASTACERVFVHAFMDGRDTAPDSGAGYIAKLEQKMREYGVGKVATINGRYYAMDRDKRWERERKAFDAMVNGKAEGGAYADPVARIKESYNNGVTDEFLIPFVVVDGGGQAGGADSRRGCVHQLQLPRRPRAADYARAGARERLEQEGRPRSRRLGVAGRDDSAQRDSEEPALPVHDAVRQALRAAAGDSAGVDGQHSGQRAVGASICATCAWRRRRSSRT